MISRLDVFDAIATLLDTQPEPCRLHTAPDPAPAMYGVVEAPPGSRMDGSFGCPESGAVLRVTVRSVARATDVEQAGRAATDLGARYAATILNRTAPLVGSGWEVSGRSQLDDSGVMTQGPVANHVATYELLVVPA